VGNRRCSVNLDEGSAVVFGGERGMEEAERSLTMLRSPPGEPSNDGGESFENPTFAEAFSRCPSLSSTSSSPFSYGSTNRRPYKKVRRIATPAHIIDKLDSGMCRQRREMCSEEKVIAAMRSVCCGDDCQHRLGWTVEKRC
jgi:hypothetical protein